MTPPPAEWAAVPFAASLLLLGMPHGAADAWALRRAARTRGPAWAKRQLVAYLGVDAAAVCLLLAAPAATLCGFLGLTAWHFGRSAADRRAGAAASAAGLARELARATLLVGLPFAFQPARTLALFDLLSAAAGGGAFPRAVVPVAVGACVAAGGVLLVGLATGRRGEPGGPGGPGRWAREAASLGALLACPLLLPPAASVGVLFLALHAGPECVRVGREAGAASPLAAVLRCHRVAWPLWALTVLLLLPAWPPVRAAVAAGGGGPMLTLACLTLLAYAALTPAHELLRAATAGLRAENLLPRRARSAGSG